MQHPLSTTTKSELLTLIESAIRNNTYSYWWMSCTLTAMAAGHPIHSIGNIRQHVPAPLNTSTSNFMAAQHEMCRQFWKRESLGAEWRSSSRKKKEVKKQKRTRYKYFKKVKKKGKEKIPASVWRATDWKWERVSSLGYHHLLLLFTTLFCYWGACRRW